MVKLQLALDLTNIEEAIKISEQLYNYIDIIEIGTPLIKEESAAESIMIMKKLFPKNLILADFKTMDAGKIEAGMAFDAGADIMTVCGTADDKTIKEVIAKSKKSGKKVMVDMIGVKDKLKRVLEIEKLNPGYICIRSVTGGSLPDSEELIGLTGKIKTKIAVAGGITIDNIKNILRLKPEIIIIGKALTKAKNPVMEAKKLNKLIGRKINNYPEKGKTERAPFVKIIKIIEDEIKNVLSKIDSKKTKNFSELLYKNHGNKIFVTGEGRSGLVGKAFAMRLMQLGYKSYFVPESTVPAMGKKDVFIALSGTGNNSIVLERLKLAKKQKSFTVAITSNDKSPLSKNSKMTIKIPAFADRNMEPLGSLFVQSALLYTDSIIVSLMIMFNKSPSSLRKFHSNL